MQDRGYAAFLTTLIYSRTCVVVEVRSHQVFVYRGKVEVVIESFVALEEVMASEPG